jgi:type II secretory pathway component PulF
MIFIPSLVKVLLFEIWFLLWLPLPAIVFIILAVKPEFTTAAIGGMFAWFFLFIFWGWQAFAYVQYRSARQEEFLFVLRTAADSQAPIEAVLGAYLKDRPKDELYRFWLIALLTFVMPGYYWIHRQRSFDFRLRRLAAMLNSGASLGQALRLVPGVASREVALAVTVGQFSGRLPETLHRLPDPRLRFQWLEMLPRFLYPILLLAFMMNILSFVMIFIIPKFEVIFLHFKMKLPYETELLIAVSRWFIKYGFGYLAISSVLGLVVLNLVMFSSRIRWYFPLVGLLYRGQARGQFLNVLGLMMQTGKPLPEVLGAVLASGLLPTAIANRVQQLSQDLQRGQPLAESLVRNGLATKSMQGLITTAQKANNLPWALEELGDSSSRRSARLSYRIAMVMFPLCILACSLLVGFAAVAMFSPLVYMLDSMAR